MLDLGRLLWGTIGFALFGGLMYLPVVMGWMSIAQPEQSLRELATEN